MGNSHNAFCADGTSFSDDIRHEVSLRKPFSVTQKDNFDPDECPFCSLRRKNCRWLRTELARLGGEASSLEGTIPQKFHQALYDWLDEGIGLPASHYTGGVEDVSVSSCSKCNETRHEVGMLLAEAQCRDAQCKARMEFRTRVASQIEDLLIEKRSLEAKLLSNGHPDGMLSDGELRAITRVNRADSIDVGDLHFTNKTPRESRLSDGEDNDEKWRAAVEELPGPHSGSRLSHSNGLQGRTYASGNGDIAL